MYGESRRAKRDGYKHDNQFSVFNMTSGTVVTFTDDGVAKGQGSGGAPNQARRSTLRKLELTDSDGDPLFVVKDLREFSAEENRYAGVGAKLKTDITLDSPSKNPDFETLRDKWEANRALREDFQRERRASYGTANPNPVLATAEVPAKRRKAVKANQEALGSSKGAA